MVARFAFAFVAASCLSCSTGFAQQADPAAEPTHADVPYGEHERQVLDFYQAESDQPTPVVFFIHGGGWGAGDKAAALRSLDIPRLLENGVSVVAINYRYVHQARAAGIEPPVKWPLEDAARALQFVRFNAEEWNLDKERIGASGGSAGACSSLWLAMHDDMADPGSNDPVAQESTRLFCAAVVGAQTSLDPHQTREWMPNSVYGGHAFGFRKQPPGNREGRDAEFQTFHDHRDEVLAFIKEYSPIEHASEDDPPLWLTFGDRQPMQKGDMPDDPTHSILFGKMLAEKLEPLGVEIIVTSPAERQGPYRNATDALLNMLKATPEK